MVLEINVPLKGSTEESITALVPHEAMFAQKLSMFIQSGGAVKLFSTSSCFFFLVEVKSISATCR